MSKKPKQEKLTNQQARAVARLGVYFLEAQFSAWTRQEFLSRFVDLRSAAKFIDKKSGYPSGGGHFDTFIRLKPEYEEIAASTALLFRLEDPNFGRDILEARKDFV